MAFIIISELRSLIGPILIETAHYIATGPLEAISLVLRIWRTGLLLHGF